MRPSPGPARARPGPGEAGRRPRARGRGGAWAGGCRTAGRAGLAGRVVSRAQARPAGRGRAARPPASASSARRIAMLSGISSFSAHHKAKSAAMAAANIAGPGSPGAPTRARSRRTRAPRRRACSALGGFTARGLCFAGLLPPRRGRRAAEERRPGVYEQADVGAGVEHERRGAVGQVALEGGAGRDALGRHEGRPLGLILRRPVRLGGTQLEGERRSEEGSRCPLVVQVPVAPQAERPGLLRSGSGRAARAPRAAPGSRS